MIETFKILSGIADYGSSLFQPSRSGRNLISRPGDQNSFKHNFFSRRVISYWNKLPLNVKNAESVNQFKNRLDKFKNTNLEQHGQFWELSTEIFNRINDSNRDNYVDFISSNPIIAQIRNINIRV